MITLTTQIKRIWIVALLFALNAQSGEPYDVKSSVQTPAGGRAAAGDYQLQGTLGQPAVGHTGGGDFSLHSGFWATTPPPNDLIFADDFE
jgi:hypothetical protein